jgi:hypothetical protein
MLRHILPVLWPNLPGHGSRALNVCEVFPEPLKISKTRRMIYLFVLHYTGIEIMPAIIDEKRLISS